MDSLPNNVIEPLVIKVEFADQDWSTVPSTPKIVLCKQKNISGFLIKESDQLISKASLISVQSIAVNEGTKRIETENSSRVETGTVSESSRAVNSIRETNEVTSQKVIVAQSPVPSAFKTPLCKQKNASGISMAASSLRNSKQLIPHAPAKKNVLTPKQSFRKKTLLATCKPKLKGSSKKKKAKLMAHGLPEQIASDLCVLTLPELLERIPSLKAEYPNIHKRGLQTPSVCAQKTQISADKPSPIDTAFLRVGIQNIEPMNKEQMTKVHRHLILAIAEQWKDGGGPEFLEFKHMDGWVMVTCVDQRSKTWLLDELKYLEPWPESQLSIMPERKLPKVNITKIIAFIPESEATSVQEALELLKAQNKGLNTEQWTLLDEKLESGKSWTVKFIIDDASLKALEAQECRAAIGFTTMNFEIIPVADIHIKSEKSQTSQESPSSSKTTAYVAKSVSSVPLHQDNKPTSTPILRANCDSRLSQNSNQGPIMGKPPTIGYIKHMLQDAKDRIEEMKQKRLSDRRFRWGRWDEPPSVLARQRILEAKNMNTARPITDDLRRRVETPTSATAQVFSAPTAVSLDRNSSGGITVIQQNFPALPAPANLGGFSAHTTARNPNMVPHSMEIPGFGVPNATTLGRIRTGGVTVTLPQQNGFTAGSEIGTNVGAFSAQATGRNPNMVPHSLEIPGFGVPNATTLSAIRTGGVTIPQQNGFTPGSEIGTNLNAFSAQVTGRNLTMMPPNTVMPGFGGPNDPNAATMGRSGIGGIAVTQQNVFSAPASQTQEMDYFLGPGGGSQFVQNQMMSQNSVNYGGVTLGQNMSVGVGNAAYQQNIALASMYPHSTYSNPPYYMNCYQDSQAAMSLLNQNHGQQGPVVQLSRNNNGSERSRDSSPNKELSQEGYRSWIIEETKRFASNLEDHSSLACKGALSPTPSPPPPPTPSPPPPPIIGNYCDQDPDRGSLFNQDSSGTHQDRHSRSYMERLSPQARERDSPRHRRRSYDRDSPSRFDSRQSPQSESDRHWDTEDYGSYKRSQSIKEEKEEHFRPSHEFRSPEIQSSCRPKNTEESENYESNWRSSEKRSDRDVPSRPNIGSPQPRRDYGDWVTENAESNERSRSSIVERSDRGTALRPDRISPQPRIRYRSWTIEGSETNEKTQSTREERDDLGRSIRPHRKSPQPKIDNWFRNMGGSETYERSCSSREKRDDLDGSLTPERRSPQPMKEYTPRNIESSENNERSRCSREETVYLNRSIKTERISPEPMNDYRPRYVEGSETIEKSRYIREDRDLDRSLKHDRKSPQPRILDNRPQNIESSETNEKSRSSREERDNLDKSLKPDRRSPQPKIDRPRNIEDSRKREKDDVRERSPRPYRRPPPPSRDNRLRIIESYKTIRMRREKLADQHRPSLIRPPPVRSGFRRENIRARSPDRRREGPGTFNRGIQRPRERDGHVRERSPVPSRSTAKPREIQRPDIRPRR
ncbi:uncharacterized protein LOC133532099 [Cydia pomonella]|uniref:uncharacterized protein LOC133532099 n=1 Tax=Cydia pomonella TaxID=82600 RepID=UPI002ADE63DC|nr:uncharacterized protein LOC133532099 [Cydia pomonella]